LKNKRIKISLAKSAGFCFGVKRAIEITLQAARQYPRIEILGDIVHNEDVARDIYSCGIKKVTSLKKGKKKIFLVRAHGIPLKLHKQAKRLGYEIIDATCPMVRHIHKIAMDMEKKDRKVIIIGDENHAEVKGIVGHLRCKPLIIEDEKHLRLEKIAKIKKACIVVQSTQDTEKVNRIFKSLSSLIEDLKLFNTICVPTRKKQTEIRTLPLKNDIMIIIGSKTSANTKRLYEISKSLNRKSYWVKSAKDLKKIWFRAAKKIGVTAGASTPDYTTKEVIKRIREITIFSNHHAGYRKNRNLS